jgi:hypothetical protein
MPKITERPSNYTVGAIRGFVMAKRAEESQEIQEKAAHDRQQKTPKKALGSLTAYSFFTFSMTDENGNKVRCVDTFKQGHAVDPDTKQVYFVDEDGVRKWTLANDSPFDQERAKMHLFKVVASDEDFLGTLKSWHQKKLRTKDGKLSTHAKSELTKVLYPIIADEFGESFL